MEEYHLPVLRNEVLSLLGPKPGGVYIDGTLGGGGHAEAILEKSGPDGKLIGLDQDSDAIKYASERLARFGDRAKIIQCNFADMKKAAAEAGFAKVDGVLLDLGVSSYQLDGPRGFSFQRDEPLDMRMSRELTDRTAEDVVNTYGEARLADLIFQYGEERYSRRIAKAIVDARAKSPIRTTKELSDLIVGTVGGAYRGQDIHPATRTFQAVRIEVNGELDAAKHGIDAAIDLLKTGGVLAVISFHSLEDRIVKQALRKYAGKCECPPRLPGCVCGARKAVRALTSKPICATDEEVRVNPRSRSAKLRGAEKIEEQ